MPFRFAQGGAGIALLLIMVHSLVDFNLRIPANAAFTALLAALFFHRSLEAERPSRRQRKAESGDGGNERAYPVYTVPPENQINPFGTLA